MLPFYLIILVIMIVCMLLKSQWHYLGSLTMTITAVNDQFAQWNQWIPWLKNVGIPSTGFNYRWQLLRKEDSHTEKPSICETEEGIFFSFAWLPSSLLLPPPLIPWDFRRTQLSETKEFYSRYKTPYTMHFVQLYRKEGVSICHRLVSHRKHCIVHSSLLVRKRSTQWIDRNSLHTFVFNEDLSLILKTLPSLSQWKGDTIKKKCCKIETSQNYISNQIFPLGTRQLLGGSVQA